MTDSLATQILAAAVTLTQLNARLGNGSDMQWSASELRREAEHEEAEDREAAQRTCMAEALAEDIFTCCFPGLQSLSDATDPDYYRRIAHTLLKSGWTKGDSGE
jgi:hypothetical protein